MATACLVGLPAAISAFTFLRKASFAADLTNGMLLTVDDGEIQHHGFSQRASRQVSQRNYARPRRKAGHIRDVRGGSSAAAHMDRQNIVGANQAICQRESYRGAGRQRRRVHGNAAHGTVQRDARTFVRRLRDGALRGGGVAYQFASKYAGACHLHRIYAGACHLHRIYDVGADNVLVAVRNPDWFGIAHDYAPIQDVDMPEAV